MIFNGTPHLIGSLPASRCSAGEQIAEGGVKATAPSAGNAKSSGGARASSQSGKYFGRSAN